MWAALYETAHRAVFSLPYVMDYFRTLNDDYAATVQLAPESLMEQLGSIGNDPSAIFQLDLDLESADVFDTSAATPALESLQAFLGLTGRNVPMAGGPRREPGSFPTSTRSLQNATALLTSGILPNRQERWLPSLPGRWPMEQFSWPKSRNASGRRHRGAFGSPTDFLLPKRSSIRWTGRRGCYWTIPSGSR